MKEQLIEFETAKLAKEKGFFIEDSGYNYSEENDYKLGLNVYTKQDVIDFKIYAAPTQSLLQKWLREKHKIFIEVHHHTDFGAYSFRVKNVHSDKISLHKYDTYEQALEKGLIEALKLIK